MKKISIHRYSTRAKELTIIPIPTELIIKALGKKQSRKYTAYRCFFSSRIETRIFNLYSPVGIVGIEQWLPYISHIGKMNSKVEYMITGEITKSKYYYFTSDISVNEFMKVRRNHWSIENSLHWVLDNSFKEDRMRMKKGSACENMNLLRKFVLNVLALTNLKHESVSASRDELRYDTPQQLLYKIMAAVE